MNEQECVLRWPAVKAMTGISRVTCWRWSKSNQFPKPKKIGPNSVGWLQSEIVAWMRTRATVGGGQS